MLGRLRDDSRCPLVLSPRVVSLACFVSLALGVSLSLCLCLVLFFSLLYCISHFSFVWLPLVLFLPSVFSVGSCISGSSLMSLKGEALWAVSRFPGVAMPCREHKALPRGFSSFFFWLFLVLFVVSSILPPRVL